MKVLIEVLYLQLRAAIRNSSKHFRESMSGGVRYCFILKVVPAQAFF